MALIELEHLFDLVSNTLDWLKGNAQFETLLFWDTSRNTTAPLYLRDAATLGTFLPHFCDSK